MNELDAFEDGLIDQFRRHPVLANIELLTDADFRALLLQRRFLSLAFTAAYDLAIDLLTDEQGLRIARVILREEYPDAGGHTRSHREEMKQDILAIGVTRAELVASRPTPVTAETITGTLALISAAGAVARPDAALLTVLRFWGEVLVSVEYGELWRRMAGHFTSGAENRSVFYYPHLVHDAKAHPLAIASPLSSTHSDQLGVRLWQLLDSPDARDSFQHAERAVVALKCGFYDQFAARLTTADAAAG